jgi:hypothetical protein
VQRSLRAMPGVTSITTCAECQRQCLSDDEDRWHAHLGGDDLDEPAELVFYCPECAEREFGAA